VLTLLSELLFVVANSGVVEFATNESASLLAKISVGNELDGLIRSKRVKNLNYHLVSIRYGHKLLELNVLNDKV